MVTYLVETSHPVARAVEIVAGEQSSGTFVELPKETDTLNESHGARVERIDKLEMVDTPSVTKQRPGANPPVFDPREPPADLRRL